ncbi:hypothetical protein Tco_1080912 [Tanacetum coccineum]|uniref:Uncharacterized protein n=1 Tax=Tanacetum coccineum TaxID=301880 RepID=A0ABQ5HXP8_9ASTR
MPKARSVSRTRLTKPKPSFYRPVSKRVNERGGASTSGLNAHGVTSNSGPNSSTPKGKASTSHAKSGGKYPSMSNSFDVLNTLAEEEECGISSSIGEFEEDSDNIEVLLPDDEMSRYISSTGGGHILEEDDLNFYDGYEAQVYDLPKQMQSFCDQFNIQLNRRVRKHMFFLSLVHKLGMSFLYSV